MSVNKLIKSSLIYTFGNVFSKALFFLVSIMLTHLLSADDYANYSLLYNFLILAGTIAAASFGIIATHEVSKDGIDALDFTKKQLPVIVLLALIVSVVMNEYIHFPTNILNEYFLCGVVLILTCMYAVDAIMQGSIVGLEQYKRLVANNMVKSTVFLLASLCLTYSFGLSGALLSVPFYIFVGFALNFETVRQHRSHIPTSKTRSDYFIESLPMLATNTLILGFMWIIGYLILTNLGGAKAAEFNVILQIIQILLFFVASLSAPLLPFLNKNKGRNADLINLYVPFLMILLVSQVVYLSGLFKEIIGGNIVNDDNHYLVLYALMIAQLSTLKFSLFRKNIQKGSTYLSLVNNVIWLILVGVYILIAGFSVENVMYAFFWSHVATFITCLALYEYYDVVSVKSLGRVTIPLITFYFIIMGVCS